MKQIAARLDIHLAGSFLPLDGDEIYNAMLLFAPDGRMWRYDKMFPYAWERAYFHAGRDIVIARTDLDDFGSLICWDVGHSELWARYAIQVDLMIISSAPIDISNPLMSFPNGRITYDEMGPSFKSVPGTTDRVFGELLDRQAPWLRVPAINAAVCGPITTGIPNGLSTMVSALFMTPCYQVDSGGREKELQLCSSWRGRIGTVLFTENIGSGALK